MSARKKRPQFLGFTLVEIITILAVISGLLIFSYLNIPAIQIRARDARRKANLQKMAIAIANYEEDTNCYPISLPVCKSDFTENGTAYLSSIPCDPETNESYVYVAEDSDCPSWFQLYGNLEYAKDATIDKVNCQYGCGPDCQFNYGVSSPNQNLNPYCDDQIASGDLDEEDDEEEIQEIQEEEDPQGDNPDQYVCSSGGACEIHENPILSGCPDIYPDDPTCQDQCGEQANRCKSSKGKLVPEGEELTREWFLEHLFIFDLFHWLWSLVQKIIAYLFG